MVILPGVNVSQLYLSARAFIQMFMPKVTSAIEERLERGESPPEVFFSELCRPESNSSEDKGLVHLWSALYHLAEGRNEEALKECSEAQQAWPNGGPIIRFFEAHALSYLRRYNEAFSCFSRSYHLWLLMIFDSLQGSPALPPIMHQWKEDFYKRWTLPGLAQGIEGLTIPNREDWKNGAEKIAAVLRLAQEDGQEDAVWSVISEVEESQGLSPEQRGQMQEFRAFIELIAIQDPFEGLRTLAKRISAVWPKDVDCVEAVREQRS